MIIALFTLLFWLFVLVCYYAVGNKFFLDGLKLIRVYTMDFSLKGKQVQLVSIADAAGNLAPVDAKAFTFTVNDATLGSVVSVNNVEANVTTTGKPGVLVVSATDGNVTVVANVTVAFDDSNVQIVPVGTPTPVV